VALARLSSLRPGDVLQTSVRVGGLVQLTAADGTVARVGQLVADGEHRAIRIQ
jgi:flagellar motor switch/type III secretory pathway protein FliN